MVLLEPLIIVYTITVSNTGGTSLSISMVDTWKMEIMEIFLLAGPTFVSSSAGSNQANLAVGEF